MTDREKLIALLHKCVRCPGVVTICEVDCPYWSNETACDEFGATADMLLANGVTVQRWIPVTERLPDKGSRVLACGERGGVFLVKAEGETTGFGRVDGGSKYRSFTHWMPLPEPPKEGE